MSIIIPVYNAEKYINDCLESILNQTLQDFEVILVNDCSTDNSRAIVQSYLEKFGGRLKIYDNEKNFGQGFSRNKGLQLSHGEYIFCVDADDLITLTALEELYAHATKFDADVVYTERHYEADKNLSNIYIAKSPRKNLVVHPTLESENLSDRVHALVERKFCMTTCSKFVRRDLLFEHEIFFPHVKISEDDIWTYELIFSARRFLRAPNIVYIWRMSENSTMRRKRTPEETLTLWLDPLVFGIKIIDDFISKFEFFQQNPQYRCAVLEFFAHNKMARIFDDSLNLPLSEIYSAVKNAFDNSLGGHEVLISWLLTDLIMQQKIFAANQMR